MNPLVLQSDFGLDDGAVSAMYGVAYSVCPGLTIHDLTHGIEPFNIWEASYRLAQTVTYWPEGAVFVSVVDPGVGSDRRSIVAKLTNGQYIVTPDNGTLTHIKRLTGIAEVRLINEEINRRTGSEECYTFYGRDVYAYTGARLAAGVISFEEVGSLTEIDSIVELPTIPAVATESYVEGTIDVLDIRFGSLWTNIGRQVFEQIHPAHGDYLRVSIRNDTRTVYSNIITYGRSFADVYVGEALIYLNSLDCVALAINQGSFAKAYNVGVGNSWKIRLEKTDRMM